MEWQLKFSKGVKEILCNYNSPTVAKIVIEILEPLFHSILTPMWQKNVSLKKAIARSKVKAFHTCTFQ